MAEKRLPFYRSYRSGNELRYINEAVATGDISGDRGFSKRCHEFLEKALGAPRVLLTTSCTSALEMCALLLDIKPGDEVILPSFTFVSTANAFVLRGARPVFVDIRPDTLNLDERALEERITPRTKAIVPVHYGGVGCEMDEIRAIAARHGIAVVEDNAHGLFGKYRGRNLGTFGALATQSFHETKNFSCGEGGALVINDQRHVERAEIIREKGTNRSRFFRGQVDKYTWVDIGSSFLASDILAAYLYAQLETRDAIQAKRRRLWTNYHDGLRGWAEDAGFRLPVIPAHCDQAYHLYYVLLPDLATRQALIKYLAERDIVAVFHYLPLHSSPMGQTLAADVRPCPVTDRVSDCLLRLPFFNDMTDADQERVLTAIRGFVDAYMTRGRSAA